MDAVAAKICSVCGIDCSAKKRAKDANGRYICADCLERAREAKVAKEGKPVVVATGPIVPKKVSAAPAMLPNGVDPIMDNLVSNAMKFSPKNRQIFVLAEVDGPAPSAAAGETVEQTLTTLRAFEVG